MENYGLCFIGGGHPVTVGAQALNIRWRVSLIKLLSYLRVIPSEAKDLLFGSGVNFPNWPITEYSLEPRP